MPAPSSFTCEVLSDGKWVAMPVDEVQAHHRDAVKRCPACGGRIMIMGGYTPMRRTSLSHFRIHDGCPLTPQHFTGEARPHPEAIR